MNPLTQFNIHRSNPVTVYDVNLKKAILIFSANKVCARYVFHKSETNMLTYIRDKIKSKPKSNKFGRQLAFRNSNVKQTEMLGDSDVLILDETLDKFMSLNDKYKVVRLKDIVVGSIEPTS